MNTYLNKLDNTWLKVDSVIVYGLGRTGQKLISHLVEYLKLKVNLIIDNNIKIVEKQQFLGIRISALDQVEDEVLKSCKIIVLTGAMAYESIKKTLEKRGLNEYKDFCNVEQFVPEFSWKLEKKIVLCQVATSITTACTLKCKNCCMFTTKIKKQKSYSINELQENIDEFFRVVDKVLCYQIFGGEPFLHRDLAAFIQYLGKHYNEKIGHIQIMTNGTIIPDENIFKVLKTFDVFVRISDYTRQVDYSDRLKKFEGLLKKYKIKYSILHEIEWSDLGFPESLHNWGENTKEIHKHMLQCSRNCQQLNDGRYYFCGVLWGAVRAGLYEQKEDEYIELKNIDVEDVYQKRILLEYSLGNISGKGYLGLCKICNGFGNDNSIVIDAGVQINN